MDGSDVLDDDLPNRRIFLTGFLRDFRERRIRNMDDHNRDGGKPSRSCPDRGRKDYRETSKLLSLGPGEFRRCLTRGGKEVEKDSGPKGQASGTRD